MFDVIYNNYMEILFIGLIAVLILIGVVFWVIKKRPEKMAPVVQKIAQTKTGQKQIAKTISRQNPKELEKTLAEQLGREQARKISRVLSQKNESDREKLLTNLIESDGKVDLSQDLYKSKTKEDGARAYKKKTDNRKKRKRAKAQRRKNR